MANDKKIITGGQQLLDPIKILQKAGIAEGMAIADLGCGTVGHFVMPAARMVGNKGKVYAVDILQSALSGVRSRAKLEGVTNIETVWSDLEVYGGTDIPENSLDLALLVNILFQVGGYREVLREAVRLVKIGGIIEVIDWKMTDIPSFGPNPKNRVKKEEVLNSAEELNLSLKEEFEAGRYHFGMIFIKK